MEKDKPKANNCAKCGSPYQAPAKFCSECGARIGKDTGSGLTLSRVLITVVVALLVWGLTKSIQSYAAAGSKPTHAFEQLNTEPNAELDSLRALVKEAPDNIEHWRDLAIALGEQVGASNTPPQQLLMEFIGALSELLKLDPNDKRAILSLANVSFEQKVFPKAVELYARYLELEPENLQVRTRYASALSFVGQYDQALLEIDKVLEQAPNDFHAQAYKAVTLAQKGERAQALQIGSKALKDAPSEEARTRLTKFLDNMKKDDTAQPEEGAGEAQKPAMPEAEVSKEYAAVVNHVRNNPIAGPRFVQSSTGPQGTLTLYFQAFPMDQMPPVIRTKFLDGIKNAASGSDLVRIVLTDNASAKEMAVIELKGE